MTQRTRPATGIGDPDGPDPIDVAVGARVRLFRQQKGMSQQALADALGVTFQQVQKYERAGNRISASMLVRAAQALGVSVSTLVEEAPAGEGLDEFIQLAGEGGALALLRAYAALPPGPLRHRVRELVQTIAESQDPSAD